MYFTQMIKPNPPAYPNLPEPLQPGLYEGDAPGDRSTLCPEFANIYPWSSFEDRVIALDRLNERLGCPPSNQVGDAAKRLYKIAVLRLRLAIRARFCKIRRL